MVAAEHRQASHLRDLRLTPRSLKMAGVRPTLFSWPRHFQLVAVTCLVYSLVHDVVAPDPHPAATGSASGDGDVSADASAATVTLHAAPRLPIRSCLQDQGDAVDELPPLKDGMVERLEYVTLKDSCDNYCNRKGEGWTCAAACKTHRPSCDCTGSALSADNCAFTMSSRICHCLAPSGSSEAAAAEADYLSNEKSSRGKDTVCSKQGDCPKVDLDSVYVNVYDDFIDEAFVDLAASALTQQFVRRCKRDNKNDHTAGWIDPNKVDIINNPHDIFEGAAGKMLREIPELTGQDWDIVEFFMHNRAQAEPQWFHFDAAEWQAYNAETKVVKLPTYSVIVYLTDEEDTHTTVFSNTLACARYKEEEWACDGKGVHAFIPNAVSDALLVRPKRGRMVIFDSRVLHGNLPSMINLPKTRQVFAFCFYKKRPKIPVNPHTTERGWRALQKELTLTPKVKQALLSPVPLVEAKLQQFTLPLLASVDIELKVPGARTVLKTSLPLPQHKQLKACDYCQINFSQPLGLYGWQ